MTDLALPSALPPNPTDAEIIDFLQRLHVWLRTREPQSDGDLLDKFIPYSALTDLELLELQSGGTLVPGSGIGGGTAELPDELDYITDLTPPTAIPLIGFIVSGGITQFIVEFEAPTYTQGGGNAYTEVYAANWDGVSALPTFANAVLVATAAGSQNVIAIPAQPGQTTHFWLGAVTRAGVRQVDGAGPTGGTNGVNSTTGVDVSDLLEILTGQITETQLFADLAERIDLIDATSATPGSVNARIQVVQDQVNTLTDAPDYDNGTTYAIGDVVKYTGKLYRAIAATTGNLPTNATYWELVGDYASLAEVVSAHTVTLDDHESRIDVTETGLAAEVTARQTLATQLRGSYAGTDPSALATGLIFNERTARVSAESAIVSDLTALQATVTSNYTTLDAAIASETTARATADSAQATDITTLQATVRGGNAGAMFPATFEEGSTYWTNTRHGDPDSIGSAAGSVVTGDADLGTCFQIINFTTAGHNILTKGVIPVVAGRVYKVTARFKVTASDGSVGFTLIGACMPADYGSSLSPSAMISAAATVIGTGAVTELSATFSDTTDEADVAWTAGTKYLRLGLRLNTAEAGLTLRVQSIRVEDVTDVTDVSAALQVESTVRASETGNLFAKYTVKIDANGYVSGFGLASTTNDGATVSDFIIRADRFSVASPSGPGLTPIVPFVVNTTTVVVNGVSVPAGIYIDAAFIKNGTITAAKIGNAVIDDAKIANLSAAKINAGTLSADRIAAGSLDANKITAGTIVTSKLQVGAATQSVIGVATATNLSIASYQIGSTSNLDFASFTRAITARATALTLEGQIAFTVRNTGWTGGNYSIYVLLSLGSSGEMVQYSSLLPAYLEPSMSGTTFLVPFSVARMTTNETMFPTGSARTMRVKVDEFKVYNPISGAVLAALNTATVSLNYTVTEFKV